jgi:hypothetical protein
VVSRTILVFGLFLLQVVSFPTKLHASGTIHTQSLTLAWDPSTDQVVVGYRLYQGAESQVYTNVLNMNDSVTAVIDGLVPGVTYYFAVTAYDESGLESAFSGEISYTVPTGDLISPGSDPKLCMQLNPFNQAVLTGVAPAGVYAVLASQDLTSWSAIATISTTIEGSFQFTDPAGPTTPFRFYRLQQITSQPAYTPSNSGSAPLPKPVTSGF